MLKASSLVAVTRKIPVNSNDSPNSSGKSQSAVPPSPRKSLFQHCLPSERLFERALLREFSVMAAGMFFVLLTILVVSSSSKLLALAASGGVASSAVAALIGFNVLATVPWLLSVTVFVTVLTALSRAWRDHEMAVWLASGLPFTAWIRPVLTFAIPMALLSAMLSLGLTPWAKQKSQEYREQLAARDDLSSVSPGLFKESTTGDRVYFIENFTGTGGAARNVFMQQWRNGVQTLTVAAEGYLETHPDGQRIMVLKNGRRYEGVVGNANYRTVEFAESRILVEEPPRQAVNPAIAAAPSLALWQSRNVEALAELSWRIAIPIAAVLLALLAIPLSYVNPRVGRTFNYVTAALLFSIYNNLINLNESWLASGRLPAIVGMWPLHLVVLLLIWALFQWRSRPRG
jgi:lipopolysaccharide export system permease protein